MNIIFNKYSKLLIKYIFAIIWKRRRECAFHYPMIIQKNRNPTVAEFVQNY